MPNDEQPQIDELTRAILENPLVPAPYYERAQAFVRAARPDEAREDFRAAIDIVRENTRLRHVDDFMIASLFQEADYLISTKRYMEAMQRFGIVSMLDPDCADVYHRQALLCLQLGHPDVAMAYLEIALSIEPTYYEARNARGQIRLSKKDYKQAMRDFEEVVAFNSICPLPRRNGESAIDAFFHAGNSLALALLNMASIARELNDFSDALTYIQLAQKYRPMWSRVYREASRLFLKLSQATAITGNNFKAGQYNDYAMLEFDQMIYVGWYDRLVGHWTSDDAERENELLQEIADATGINLADYRDRLSRAVADASFAAPVDSSLPSTWLFFGAWTVAVEITRHINSMLVIRIAERPDAIRRFFCICGHEDISEGVTGCFVSPVGDGVYVATMPYNLILVMDFLRVLTRDCADGKTWLFGDEQVAAVKTMLASEIDSGERFAAISKLLEASPHESDDAGCSERSAKSIGPTMRTVQYFCILHEAAHVVFAHFDVLWADREIQALGLSETEFEWCREFAADRWAIATTLAHRFPPDFQDDESRWWEQIGWEVRLYMGLIAVREAQVTTTQYPPAQSRFVKLRDAIKDSEGLAAETSQVLACFDRGVKACDVQLAALKDFIGVSWKEWDVLTSSWLSNATATGIDPLKLQTFEDICRREMELHGIFGTGMSVHSLLVEETSRNA